MEDPCKEEGTIIALDAVRAEAARWTVAVSLQSARVCLIVIIISHILDY
jgi:hypothetical protein